MSLLVSGSVSTHSQQRAFLTHPTHYRRLHIVWKHSHSYGRWSQMKMWVFWKLQLNPSDSQVAGYTVAPPKLCHPVLSFPSRSHWTARTYSLRLALSKSGSCLGILHAVPRDFDIPTAQSNIGKWAHLRYGYTFLRYSDKWSVSVLFLRDEACIAKLKAYP